jgi:hypothetical protein
MLSNGSAEALMGEVSVKCLRCYAIGFAIRPVHAKQWQRRGGHGRGESRHYPLCTSFAFTCHL